MPALQRPGSLPPIWFTEVLPIAAEIRPCASIHARLVVSDLPTMSAAPGFGCGFLRGIFGQTLDYLCRPGGGHPWLTFSRHSLGREAFGTLAIFMMTLFIQRACMPSSMNSYVSITPLDRN
jgi:hypothetical protein